MAVGTGFEPAHGLVNNQVPYQLGYPTRKLESHKKHKITKSRSDGDRWNRTIGLALMRGALCHLSYIAKEPAARIELATAALPKLRAAICTSRAKPWWAGWDSNPLPLD